MNLTPYHHNHSSIISIKSLAISTSNSNKTSKQWLMQQPDFIAKTHAGHDNSTKTPQQMQLCIWYHIRAEALTVIEWLKHSFIRTWVLIVNIALNNIVFQRFERQGVPGPRSSSFLCLCNWLHLCISTYNSTTNAYVLIWLTTLLMQHVHSLDSSTPTSSKFIKLTNQLTLWFK